jgi:hypothetical protein
MSHESKQKTKNKNSCYYLAFSYWLLAISLKKDKYRTLCLGVFVANFGVLGWV